MIFKILNPEKRTLVLIIFLNIEVELNKIYAGQLQRKHYVLEVDKNPQ